MEVGDEFAGVPDRSRIPTRRRGRIGLTSELSLRVQQMDEDGIVLGWSAPWRPEQDEIERLTGHESVVSECVAQEANLIGEGCGQGIIRDRRARKQPLQRGGRRPAVNFDGAQSKVTAGLIALRVEDWQVRGVLSVSVVSSDAQPVSAGWGLRVDVDLEGSYPGSVDRPVTGNEA